MNDKKKNKVVVITGVGKGVGLNLFLRFLKSNYFVAGITRSQDDIDHINKLSGPMATTQRCAMVLLGLASSIGANGISIAEMFAPTARKFLKDEA